jgi:catechol 1,2-dioxygenase
MTATITAPTATPTGARLNAIVDDVQAALVEIVNKHRVTQEEYRAATEWLANAGTQHLEIPLLLDVFLAVAVDDVAHHSGDGTDCNVEGPVYVPGAPELQAPYVLPQRADEPGERLVFSGTVRRTDGTPLADAILDVWQANGAGEYSHFNPGVPDYNLRGKLRTDATGRFEFATVVPSEYSIPLAGSTGQLLAALGRTGIRPAHIHFKISHPAAAPLTTQIYFTADPFLRSDVVGAAKESLAVDTQHHVDDHGRRWATCSFDFVLNERGHAGLPPGPAPLSADDLLDRTRTAFDAFSAGDSSVLAEMLADDVEWVVPGNSKLSGVKRGKEEVFEHWATFGPALRGAEWKHFLCDGQRVLVVYTLTFDAGSCDGVDVIEFHDGKIVRFQPNLDTALLERIFGSVG